MKRLLFAAALLAVAAPAAAQESAPADGPPRLSNADEVRAAVPALYPDTLRALRVGARVRVRMRVDPDGTVGASGIMRSGAFAPLDSAALRVVALMRFEPARVAGEPVAQWV